MQRPDCGWSGPGLYHQPPLSPPSAAIPKRGRQARLGQGLGSRPTQNSPDACAQRGNRGSEK